MYKIISGIFLAVLFSACGQIDAPPIADAGSDVTVPVGTLVELSGVKSADPERRELKYTWKIDSAPASSQSQLSSHDTAITSLIPDLPGEYVVSLTVNDGVLSSPPVKVMVKAIEKVSPTFRFSVESLSVVESAQTIELPIQLSAPSNTSLEIPFTISGSAKIDSDYRLISSNPLVIPAGVTAAKIVLEVIDDNVTESAENISITLGDSGDYKAVNGSVDVTIEANDIPQPSPVTILPIVEFTLTKLDVLENAAPIAIAIRSDKILDRDITIPFDVEYRTLSSSDVNFPASGTVTLAKGSDTGKLEITIVDNNIFGPSAKDLLIKLRETAEFKVGGNNSVQLTITDDELAPTIDFETSAVSVSEGTATASLKLKLSHPSASDVQANYAITGSAQASVDYNLAIAPITITPGQLTAEIPISIVDDTIYESDENVVVTLQSPTGGILGVNKTATLTISDNDSPPVINLEPNPGVNESTPTNDAILTLSNASANTITIPFAISGTATAGSDYTVPASPIVIPAGQTSATLTFTIINDNVTEPNETVITTLGNPVSGATLGNSKSITFPIIDDETPLPTVSITAITTSTNENGGIINATISISNPSSIAVTVPLQYTGTATRNNDFTAPSNVTIPANSASAQLPISILDDNVDEPNETIGIQLGTPVGATLGAPSSVTLTINDNDPAPTASISLTSSSVAESTGTVNFNINLSNPSSGAITIPFVVSGTATTSNDFTIAGSSVTISAGQTSATIPVSIVDDNIDEPNETVILTMQTGGNYSLGTASATLTITDNDPVPTASISLTNSSVAESAGTVSFNINLSNPSSVAITIPFVVSGTATSPNDFTITGSSVTIAAGQTSSTIPSIIVDDNVDEPNETVIVTLQTGVNYSLGTASTTLTVNDNDPTPTATISLTNNSVAESAGTVNFNVSLSNPSANVITIPFAVSGTATLTSDFTVTGTSVSIPAGQTSAVVPITIVNDTIAEPNETVIVALQSATNVTIGTPSSATLTIVDDDSGSLTVSVSLSAMTVSEGSSANIITTLSGTSSTPVTIPFTLSGNAARPGDYDVSTTSIVIPAGQSSLQLAVNAVTDALIEPNEQIILTIGNVTGATLSTSSTMTLTINDETTPADTYFAMAVTENSHNHVGSNLLFLDFQSTQVNTSVIQHDRIISPRRSQTITMDGDASDWTSANFTVVPGRVQNNYPLSKHLDGVATDITVGSTWDDQNIYFVASWVDAGYNASTKAQKWVYDGSQWKPQAVTGATAGAPNDSAVNKAHIFSGVEDEDRLLMMFPIVDMEGTFKSGGLGCASYCHANLRNDNSGQDYTGTGVSFMGTNWANGVNPDDAADIWQWRSTRTAPSNVADDEVLRIGLPGIDGRVPDSGTAAYQANNLVGGNPQYRHSSGLAYTGDVLTSGNAVAFSGTPSTGQTIPAFLSQTPSGSRGDVQAYAQYNATTHRWTVELRRARVTGNADDRQFEPGTNAIAPPVSSVLTANITNGQNIVSNTCRACHGVDGIGAPSGTTWNVPRIQRASASLVKEALLRVGAMSGVVVSPNLEQGAVDVAAYLQTKATQLPVYNLNVTVNGLPGSESNVVTSSPVGISCPTSCQSGIRQGTLVTLTAKSVAGYSFNGWSGCTPTATPTICTLTVSSNTSVSASYQAATVNYTLSINNSGNGTVAYSPNGVNGTGSCAANQSCTIDYNANSSVSLTATASTGYQFNGWTGACTGSNPCSVTMDAAKSVTPTYQQIINNSLTLSSNGNGSINITRLDTNVTVVCAATSCSYSYPSTVTVRLNATPDTNYRFDQWGGDCSGGGTCDLAMTSARSAAAVFVAIVVVPQACATPQNPVALTSINFGATSLASGLSSPTHVTNAGDGSGRLFIVEKGGTIRVFQNNALQAGTFINIVDRVDSTYHNEAGLFSIAFHPEFALNNKFYVDYTSGWNTTINRCPGAGQYCSVISEFTYNADTTTMKASERVLLTINQPAGNHNGGQIAFGPDGYLYIGMGDGGSANDPNNRAQTMSDLLGKMLRIDVNSGSPYAIPTSNPYASSTGSERKEIFAYGLRNPWRFSFDPVTGSLYAGDVGQDAREEIDIVKLGKNYGWRIMEGLSCNAYYSTSCTPPTNYDPPIIDYARPGQWGSVAGGVVYRGSTYPDMCGVYMYTDTATGLFFALRYNGSTVTDQRAYSNPTTISNNITSFGYDENYEVYFVDYADGNLYRLTQIP